MMTANRSNMIHRVEQGQNGFATSRRFERLWI